ncbi:hydrolase [Sphingobacterium prati]|uniref:hydrolase n=1 Tax=Sphingobacterium prati TaxID=2737006 RepID=UPI001554A1FC|nr:hydrolase [Sphingobacterium prati]NPE45467.1 hydrolase [Sphingobacterium prati]
MSSLPIRDTKADHLLTGDNSVLIIIDYQAPQINSIASMDRQLLINNINGTIEAAKLYNVPIVLSTVNVNSGLNHETIPQIKKHLEGIPSIDRTSINSWEDREFVEAVKATGRKKLIFTALWTEACLAFPVLDALKEGYEVYMVVDAVGGTSKVAHDTAIKRLENAGAVPISTVQLFCELQRDWKRTETVPGFLKLFIETGGTAGIQFGFDSASKK